MENLTKARISIYIFCILILLFCSYLLGYIYSCIGFGPCVYKEYYSKSDIIKYEESALFWDSFGVNSLGVYKVNNVEYENFKIDTIYGDFIDFDIVISYDIDSKEISKNDLYLFIDEFRILRNKEFYSYLFRRIKKINKDTSIEDIEKCIYDLLFYESVKDKLFIKNFDFKIKILKIKAG